MNRLLYFRQDGCAPCDRAKVILGQLLEQVPTAEVIEIDARTLEGRALVQQYSVRVTPTIVAVTDDWKRVAGVTGGMVNVGLLTRLLTLDVP